MPPRSERYSNITSVLEGDNIIETLHDRSELEKTYTYH